jgi:hypothetical protein
MANEEHLAILKRGVEEWNNWCRKYQFIVPDLGGADLGLAKLTGTIFANVDLKDCPRVIDVA